jgi:hypothetical protein
MESLIPDLAGAQSGLRLLSDVHDVPEGNIYAAATAK